MAICALHAQHYAYQQFGLQMVYTKLDIHVSLLGGVGALGGGEGGGSVTIACPTRAGCDTAGSKFSLGSASAGI